MTRASTSTNLGLNGPRTPGAFICGSSSTNIPQPTQACGELVIGGPGRLLSVIDCPLFLLAGTKDHITPAEQVWALADLVSNAG